MYKIANLILGSSNQSKINEYNNFGLNLKTLTIKDLKEVDGSELEVIIHKVLELGEENIIVEDTSLQVEGSNVGVNAKWLMDSLHTNQIYNNRKATWTVYIGLKCNDQIYVFTSSTTGVISQSKAHNRSFGFDAIFIPDGSDKTLFELSSLGRKADFSPRKKAIDQLLSKQIIYNIKASEIPPWTGKYQAE